MQISNQSGSLVRSREIETVRLEIDPRDPDSSQSKAAIRKAARIIREGGTVAFPTETVYGLGANALDAAAVRKIFEAKRRPSYDPLIVHIADRAQLNRVVEAVPPAALLLIEKFWPGPLTLLMPRHPGVPAIVSAGLPRVGVRMPSHPIAHRLIEAAGVPIAAPSANLFRHTSPTQATFVLEDLDGRIDAVLDAGEATLGLESTVIDICESPAVLYRPGMVSREQIEEVLGPVAEYHPDPPGVAASEDEADSTPRPAPGVGMKHYAPRARLILTGLRDISQLVHDLGEQGERVGLMQPEGYFSKAARVDAVYRWGKWSDPAELAQRLYAGLRQLDRAHVTVILCPMPGAGGVGTAIRDRLMKAAQPDLPE